MDPTTKPKPKNLLQKILPLVQNHDGKEKLARVLQYFLIFYLEFL